MTPEEIVQDVEQLCSLPDAVIRANELIDSPHAGAAEIGEVIAHDPALSAQLLRLVNSAFYGFPSTIDSLSRAISVVGTGELRSLILSASATQVFNQVAPELIDMDDFWHRSVYVGLMAGKLSSHLESGKGETAFLIGLLHDIGKVVMFRQLPDEMQRVLETAQQSGQPLFRVENEQLGFCAADVGAALLDNWRIGDRIAVPVRFQHRPAEAHVESVNSQLLNLSLAVTACVDPELKEAPVLDLKSLDIDQRWLAASPILLQDIDHMIMEVNMECFEVLQIVNPTSLAIY